jgi:dTDP-glucose 4,6-dehydratase/UDP-glucuronate decarboxylase
MDVRCGLVEDVVTSVPLAHEADEILARVTGWDRLAGRTILVTGGAGFLGCWVLACLARANDTLLSHDPARIVCIDTLFRGVPPWFAPIAERDDVQVVRQSIAEADLTAIGPCDFILHLASIASPTYYRLHPLETIDANVEGTKRVLAHAVASRSESVLVMSSSEIYGDPPADRIPTAETFWGHVSCTGPRACYDESKRLAETLSVNYHRVHGARVKIARPFNNYGPFMPIDDRRLVPDIARGILTGGEVVLFSDGRATRTFCYATDAVAGYFQLLFSSHDAEAFNIGADAPEISVRELTEMAARVARETLGIDVRITGARSDDADYLVDNPNRRCPDLSKARAQLGYEPAVGLEEGLRRTLRWYAETARA